MKRLSPRWFAYHVCRILAGLHLAMFILDVVFLPFSAMTVAMPVLAVLWDRLADQVRPEE